MEVTFCSPRKSPKRRSGGGFRIPPPENHPPPTKRVAASCTAFASPRKGKLTYFAAAPFPTETAVSVGGGRATKGSGCSPNRRTERTEVCEDEAAAPPYWKYPPRGAKLGSFSAEILPAGGSAQENRAKEPPRRAEGGIRGELVPARKARLGAAGDTCSAEHVRALCPPFLAFFWVGYPAQAQRQRAVWGEEPQRSE